MRLALALIVATIGVAAADERTPNTLTAQEKTEGWRLLFDGRTTSGWRGFRQQTMPDGWKVMDGTLTRVAKAGDIVSNGEFDNFELTAEWKIAPRANSGIFYRVVENENDPEMWMVAPEYQIIDDRGYPQPLKPKHMTATNYALQ